MALPFKKDLKYTPPEGEHIESFYVAEGEIETSGEREEKLSVSLNTVLTKLAEVSKSCGEFIDTITTSFADYTVESEFGTISPKLYSEVVRNISVKNNAKIAEIYETETDNFALRPELNFLEPLVFVKSMLDDEADRGIGQTILDGTGVYTEGIYKEKIDAALELAQSSEQLLDKAKYFLSADTYTLGECVFHNLFGLADRIDESDFAEELGKLREFLLSARRILKTNYVLTTANSVKVRTLFRTAVADWAKETGERETEDVLLRILSKSESSVKDFLSKFVPNTGCENYDSLFSMIANSTYTLLDRQKQTSLARKIKREERVKSIGGMLSASNDMVELNETIRRIDYCLSAIDQLNLGSKEILTSVAESMAKKYTKERPVYFGEEIHTDWFKDVAGEN